MHDASVSDISPVVYQIVKALAEFFMRRETNAIMNGSVGHQTGRPIDVLCLQTSINLFSFTIKNGDLLTHAFNKVRQTHGQHEYYRVPENPAACTK